MLYTDDIKRILACDRRTQTSFRGVYARDELPSQTPTSSLYVCNTDPSTRSGQHWVVIYIDGKRRGEFFDSTGLFRPIELEFEKFLNDNTNCWTRNTKAVQHMMSDACGYHCVFYSVYRCLGFDLNAIINMYSANTMYNDSIVKEFVRDKVIM